MLSDQVCLDEGGCGKLSLKFQGQIIRWSVNVENLYFSNKIKLQRELLNTTESKQLNSKIITVTIIAQNCEKKYTKTSINLPNWGGRLGRINRKSELSNYYLSSTSTQ